jgi:hypothetical protein
MPRQNRVDPFGAIIATPERGQFLGNRGVLHDEQGHIRRHWNVKRWILCVLEFRGRKRTVMTPNRYTELFFLDEATGLAAGHRPCAECRRKRFNDFREAWVQAKLSAPGAAGPFADEMDERLHSDRIRPDRAKRTFPANVDTLPNGVFLTDNAQRAFLLWDDQLLAWSPAGYHKRLPRPKGETVDVLTPESMVEVLRAGFVPEIHPTGRPVQ